MNRQRNTLASLCVSLLVTCTFGFVTTAAADKAATVERMGEDIRYLASDELEGRGPGTEGLRKAARYIGDRFQSLGLRGAGEDGSFMRPFEISVDTKVVPDRSSLVLRGPEGRQLKLELGEDYQPLATGGSGKVKAAVVFTGYGISAPKLKYDDYQDADVAGKVLLIIRREPQQDDPKSVFDGKRVTSHSYIRTKIQAAKKNKAAAVLLVNDPFTTKAKKQDDLTRPGGFGTGARGMPFAHLKQAAANEILAQSPVKAGDESLPTVEAISAEIDDNMTPMTQPVEGWTAELEFTFETVKAEVSNVVGVIEGEGPLADETVVVGAHYDHLGYGPRGSRRPNERAIHNGADDNASGTAAVMELAKRFAQRGQKPARRMVFITFTAEERGLVGSNYYLEHPPFPLESTAFMLNFDMIGHLRDEGLLLGGVRTAKELASLVDKTGEGGDLKVKVMGSLGGSDHAGFYRKGIPVLFFFTGLTDTYHTPDDDFETINVEGAVEAVDFAERMLDAVVAMPERLVYTKTSQPARVGGAMAYLGVVPDYGAGDGNGLRLTDVNADSPASQGGLQAGDVIIKFGDIEVADIQDLADGLRKYKAGQKVEIVVRRDDDEKTCTVTLGEPRRAP
ncbi:MAG: M20/M25/M40 family metallo-hydrolase [Planctomycetota bacterium]